MLQLADSLSHNLPVFQAREEEIQIPIHIQFGTRAEAPPSFTAANYGGEVACRNNRVMAMTRNDAIWRANDTQRVAMSRIMG